MSKYNTKQRKLLLDYLSCHTDLQLSAKSIADALESEGISLSAVYRNLSELENEGKIRRVSVSGGRETHYQYIDAQCCKDKLHLSCKECGRTYHMKLSGAESLLQSVAQTEEFEIDKSQTVLYGTCKDCRKHCFEAKRA